MASLNAWPAFTQVDNNGWIARFADGYTKRANSVTILQPNTILLENQVLHYEHLYNRKGQPCIFRLLSFNNNLEIEEHSTHIKIINNIKGKYLLAVLSKNKNIMSCGLGVISDGLFGIFDIMTHPQYRNKGYGYELINGMLHWAIQNHAYAAYVQVIPKNTPAVGLYQKLGYELSYEYIYKIQNFVQ